MRVAIMQPYFLPYIGYFQLIAAVDVFVVYDNIKYTKKGWINRNRMLQNGSDTTFTLPLKGAPDSLDVVERELAPDFNREKLLNQLKSAYRLAPHFNQTLPLVERIVRYEDPNLFRYLHHSICQTCSHLGIATEIRVSSDIGIDHSLKAQDKVLALCEATGADTYINAGGGVNLYSKDEFRSRGVDLKFIQSVAFDYPQFVGPFVPWLSIVDVMMFNSTAAVRQQITTGYNLI